MSEMILKDILCRLHDEEFAAFDDPPEFVTSKRHDRAMKRIFRIYRKNADHLRRKFVPQQGTGFRLNRKTVLILAVLVFIALAAGFAQFFLSDSFRGEVRHDNTHIFAVNTANSPSRIERAYILKALPEGFALDDSIASNDMIHRVYKDRTGRKIISFTQFVKSKYSAHANTEHTAFEKTTINGHEGLFLDNSKDGSLSTSVVWDSGDYILELWATLPRDELIALAESADTQP